MDPSKLERQSDMEPKDSPSLRALSDLDLEPIGVRGIQVTSAKPVAETDIAHILKGTINLKSMSSNRIRSRSLAEITGINNVNVLIKVIPRELRSLAFITKILPTMCCTIGKLTYHPNIAMSYDMFHSRSAAYLVSEHTPGVDVVTYMIHHEHDEEIARKLFHQVLSGFKYAHNRDVIHRDLRSSCVIVNNIGLVKLHDFGMHPKLLILSKSRRNVRTKYAYTAPEVIKSARDESKAADVYSIGVLLYVMLHGRLPFEGQRREILKKICRHSPKFYSGIPKEAKRFIKTMIHPDPWKRPMVIECMYNEWTLGLDKGKTTAKRGRWASTPASSRYSMDTTYSWKSTSSVNKQKPPLTSKNVSSSSLEENSGAPGLSLPEMYPILQPESQSSTPFPEQKEAANKAGDLHFSKQDWPGNELSGVAFFSRYQCASSQTDDPAADPSRPACPEELASDKAPTLHVDLTKTSFMPSSAAEREPSGEPENDAHDTERSVSSEEELKLCKMMQLPVTSPEEYLNQFWSVLSTSSDSKQSAMAHLQQKALESKQTVPITVSNILFTGRRLYEPVTCPARGNYGQPSVSLPGIKGEAVKYKDMGMCSECQAIQAQSGQSASPTSSITTQGCWPCSNRCKSDCSLGTHVVFKTLVKNLLNKNQLQDKGPAQYLDMGKREFKAYRNAQFQTRAARSRRSMPLLVTRAVHTHIRANTVATTPGWQRQAADGKAATSARAGAGVGAGAGTETPPADATSIVSADNTGGPRDMAHHGGRHKLPAVLNLDLSHILTKPDHSHSELKPSTHTAQDKKDTRFAEVPRSAVDTDYLSEGSTQF